MILTIENPEGLDLNKFAGWLCDRIETVATDPVNQSGPEIAMWDRYLENNNFEWDTDETGNKSIPSVRFIINQYFSHLVIGRKGNDYVITCDPEAILNNTPYKIDTLASYINYGTATEVPYPYFDYIFDFFAEHLNDYYTEWRLLE